jgi:hypothetical protein
VRSDDIHLNSWRLGGQCHELMVMHQFFDGGAKEK